MNNVKNCTRSSTRHGLKTVLLFGKLCEKIEMKMKFAMKEKPNQSLMRGFCQQTTVRDNRSQQCEVDEKYSRHRFEIKSVDEVTFVPNNFAFYISH